MRAHFRPQTRHDTTASRGVRTQETGEPRQAQNTRTKRGAKRGGALSLPAPTHRNPGCSPLTFETQIEREKYSMRFNHPVVMCRLTTSGYLRRDPGGEMESPVMRVRVKVQSQVRNLDFMELNLARTQCKEGFITGENPSSPPRRPGERCLPPSPC